MPIAQNTFKGMDMDTSFYLRDSSKYWKLNNGLVLSEDEFGNGSITNEKGNAVSFRIPTNFSFVKDHVTFTANNPVIIGGCAVGSYLVIFTTDVSNTTPVDIDGVESEHQLPRSDANIGQIWAIKYNNEDDSIDNLRDETGVVNVDPTQNIYLYAYPLDDGHLVFVDYLNFATNKPIKSIGNYETDNRIKVYWTDSYNNLRHINILEEDILYAELDHLEIVEDVDLTQPKAKIINGGSLKPGVVQYSFSLYNYGGSETKFSPLSDFIMVTNSNQEFSSSIDYLGQEYIEEESSNAKKSAKIYIGNLDTNYDFLRLVRLQYTDEYGTPEITIIADEEISKSNNLSFIDNGTINLGTYSYAEFASFGGVLFTPEDIEVVRNKLIAGNIQEKFYDPKGYDARSFQFGVAGECQLSNSAGELEYTLTNSSGVITFDDGITSGQSLENLPLDIDAVNLDPNNDRYYFDGSGNYIVGADGLNIKIKIKLLELPIEKNKFSVGVHSNKEHYAMYYSQEGSVDQDWSTLGENFLDNKNNYSGYASDVNAGQIVGYQRDETYRFGIVFFDSKGRNSFVNWICDFRMPDFNTSNQAETTYYDYVSSSNKTDFPLTTVKTDNNEMETIALVMYPEVTVRNLPEGAVSYQIVRSIRSNDDKSVLAFGMVTPLFKLDDVYHPSGNVADFTDTYADGYIPVSPNNGDLVYDSKFSNFFDITNFHPRGFNLLSPEFSFMNQSVSGTAVLKLHSRSIINDHYETVPYNDGRDFTENIFERFFKTFRVANNDGGYTVSIDIDKYKTILNEQTEIISGLHDTDNYVHNINASGEFNNETYSLNAHGGKAFVGFVPEAGSTIYNFANSYYSDTDILFGSIYVENISRYNGNSYSAKKTTRYIPASKINTYYIANVFGGDTYITMFEALRSYYWPEADSNDRVMFRHNENIFNENDDYKRAKTMMESVVFPCESVVNCDLRCDKPYSKHSSTWKRMITQDKGIHQRQDKGSNGSPEVFSQDSDMYVYNYAYIRNKNAIIYREKPLQFDKDITRYNHRLLASQPKADGEGADSWLKFLPNDYIDVNGINGPVNALSSIGDYLLYFQDKSIGAIQIDERSLIGNDSGISIMIGSGQVFGGAKEISPNIGCKHRSSVVKTKSGVYFYDSYNNNIDVIKGTDVYTISQMKGINSYLKNNISKELINGNSPSVLHGVVAGYDSKNSRIYFTFNQTSNSFTVNYNELIDEFESFHSYMPTHYFDHYGRFLTVYKESNPSLSTSVWQHNTGDYGSFYGTDYNTTVTLIFNESPHQTKVWDGIEYYHYVEKEGNEVFETFNTTRAYNDYGDTGNKSTDSTLRFRTWRMKIPRVTVSGSNYRMHGKYLKVDLIFENRDDQSITRSLQLQPVIAHWRPVGLPMN
jgi:hypothetical protein